MHSNFDFQDTGQLRQFLQPQKLSAIESQIFNLLNLFESLSLTEQFIITQIILLTPGYMLRNILNVFHAQTDLNEFINQRFAQVHFQSQEFNSQNHLNNLIKFILYCEGNIENEFRKTNKVMFSTYIETQFTEADQIMLLFLKQTKEFKRLAVINMAKNAVRPDEVSALYNESPKMFMDQKANKLILDVACGLTRLLGVRAQDIASFHQLAIEQYKGKEYIDFITKWEMT
ncbi:Hypothetical_protein [Hexamita inflata]|uniref:Hypothetical_protein n=1 Tax=Hexamita inflata TaxID=28002 RepID=A0AA86NAL8_9EUKA|nr:Hypothetical protein HINF_LOCUS3440 [Hexamita inflata]